jgi:hypothetical protein
MFSLSATAFPLLIGLGQPVRLDPVRSCLALNDAEKP